MRNTKRRSRRNKSRGSTRRKRRSTRRKRIRRKRRRSPSWKWSISMRKKLRGRISQEEDWGIKRKRRSMRRRRAVLGVNEGV